MKLLMLINTTGLDYDDRLRKEALSLHRLGNCISIAALEYTNRTEQRIVYDCIPALTVHLRSRNWLKRASGLSIKTLELYVRFLLHVVRKKPEAVWIHNLELGGLIPLLALLQKAGYIRRLIWDQHELPPDATLANKQQMSMFCWLMNRCNVVIMANEERRDLMQQILSSKLNTSIKVLHNYPDQIFSNLPRIALPKSVTDWLQDTPYILAQGGANPDRHLPELITAILQQRDLKLVVIGPYQQSQLDTLDQQYGPCWCEWVNFTGFVPQMEIAPYIDHAVASVVFYIVTNKNSYLCAPNRLYQALSRGTPVIVGSNPPLVRLVEKYDCGVSVDHASPASILNGIRTILKYQPTYRSQAFACQKLFRWEIEENCLAKIVA